MTTVLMNAGPWLTVPPAGYGGIENVIASLVPELRRLGVRVVLATVGGSTLPADEMFTVFPEPQFRHLQQPYNQVCGIGLAHQNGVVRALRDRDDIDLVHDHVEAVGPAVLTAMGREAGPTLHTLHWDLAKHPDLYAHLDGGQRIRVNGVSASQLARAPAALRGHALGHVHVATPLAVGAESRDPADRGRHVLVLGRITPPKGQDVAVRLAHRAGFDLVLAGPVGPYRNPEELTGVGPEADHLPDVRYWRERVAPYVDGTRVRWVGDRQGAERDELLATARATLFPLRWEEPGGLAAMESLALGTPVVASRRGCLPELIDHGRTGLLADDDDDLADLVLAATRLDGAECRREAARRFTPAVMARGYVELYERLLGRPAG